MNAHRWQQMIEALGLPQSSATDETYQAIVIAYAEPQRFYHTAIHIDDCLRKLDTAKNLATHPAEIECALWFHDGVYKPYTAGNEAASATWARAFLHKAGAATGQIQRIDDLIMATQHAVPATTADAKLLVNIDLSILGASVADYGVFEKNVRKEYRWVPYFLYRKKRAEILQSFLDRKKIYENDFFADQFEQTARCNLAEAIKQLGGAKLSRETA